MKHISACSHAAVCFGLIKIHKHGNHRKTSACSPVDSRYLICRPI
uniref:Uncharacterized protein n=1 Tax=Arundo donax TaxID=35708 RepID=A0A0A9AIM0_ARUDO